MYSTGTGHDVTPFISISWRRHFVFRSSLAKIKVVKEKGNVNFLEDYKNEIQRKVSNHSPLYYKIFIYYKNIINIFICTL